MTALIRHLLCSIGGARRCPSSVSVSTAVLRKFPYSDHRESAINDLSEDTTSPMDIFVNRLRIRRESPTLKTRRPTTTVIVEDDECDRMVTDSLQRDDLNGALSSLERFAASGRYPRRSRTLLIVACTSSSKGHVDGVLLARDLCQSAFPIELDRLMGYRQYEAEAMWKKGDHAQALALFLKLIDEHPMQRRKLINLSCFCLKDIVAKNRLSDLGAVALDFVEQTKDFSWVPAVNLWRAAFCSDSYEAQCFARTLLDRHGRPMHESVASKVSSIATHERPDVLQRLMETLLALDMKEGCAEVMGAYVEHLCDLEDVSGAKEALRFMNRTSIFIKGEAAKRLVSMLIDHGAVPKLSKPKVSK